MEEFKNLQNDPVESVFVNIDENKEDVLDEKIEEKNDLLTPKPAESKASKFWFTVILIAIVIVVIFVAWTALK